MSQRSRIVMLLAALLLTVGYVQATTNETMTVAQDGRAKAVIVITADATEPERHAADEPAFSGRLPALSSRFSHPLLSANAIYS